MFDRLRYEPRRSIIAVGALAGLVVLAVIAAIAVRLTGGTSAPAAQAPATVSPVSAATSGVGTASPSPTAMPAASDVAQWNARPAVTPAVSSTYPAIPTSASRDATSFAQAFGTELFTCDFRTATRAELLAWAQYESAPLRAPNYPKQDWTKVLVDSLTDLSWDVADDTPVPAQGTWLALRSERAVQRVSDVKVSLDPQWEQWIGSGHQPPDALATERDVSLTLTRTTEAAGRTTVTKYSISLDLQLGTSQRGDYGVAVTNNYVVKEVS